MPNFKDYIKQWILYVKSNNYSNNNMYNKYIDIAILLDVVKDHHNS